MEAEFKRWLEAGRPSVWYKTKHTDEEWMKVYPPAWNPKNDYIVDDKHTTFRMLQVDKQDTKFEVRTKLSGIWLDTEPTWDLDYEYRVKVQEPKVETYYEVLVYGESTYAISQYLETQSAIDKFGYIKTGRSFELPKKEHKS